MKDISPIINSDYYINQSDSNIKNFKLGSSGKTVQQSGCYICSIAMIICWYLGDSSDDTKKALVRQMASNCTSSGGYSNADIKYNGRTFKIDRNLSDMSQKLLDGYPSICQVPGHFVVINGYDTNKSNMDAFLVLDPGYRKHKTLQDTMNRYEQKIKSKRFVYEA